ncbi:MAG TPA: hypothetical protein VK571_11410 [Gemmatimonadaceae bacterium]|nr:hypothetical protein [Gemmatimonadaceae bacterium]
MTDLSVTHPSAYAAMTAACWAIPAIALVWGVIRLGCTLRRPCGERCALLGPTVWKTYHCGRRRRHSGNHRSGSFEWVDDETVLVAGKDPAARA